MTKAEGSIKQGYFLLRQCYYCAYTRRIVNLTPNPNTIRANIKLYLVPTSYSMHSVLNKYDLSTIYMYLYNLMKPLESHSVQSVH